MFLLGFARLTRTSTFTSLAVCTAHVSGGKRLPPSRANTANSAIIRRENRLTRGVLWTRHKFSSSLRRKPSEAPFGTTARYRFALRASLCARLAALNIKRKPCLSADGPKWGFTWLSQARAAAGLIESVGVQICPSFQSKTPPSRRIASAASDSLLCPLSAPRPPSPAPCATFSRTTVSALRPSSRHCSLRQSAEP